MVDKQNILNFPANNAAVRRALEDLRTGFEAWGLTENLCASAELVLAEVLNNIIEHAMAQRPGGLIHVLVDYRDASLTCELRDDGAPMPGLVLPKGSPPKIGTSISDLPEGGFGWHLIRSLAQDLEYNRQGDWNCLRFSLSVNTAMR